MKNLNIKMPHSFTIIFFLVAVAAALTWYIPAGAFERFVEQTTGQDLIVPGTFSFIEQNPQGLTDILKSLVKGIISTIDIAAYVLIMGGAYGIILHTKALEIFFGHITRTLKNKNIILIPIMMTLFAIAGTSTGYWEETVSVVIIIVPLMIAAGYDAVVGVAVIMIGAGSGVIASIANPFSTGIGSDIAQIPINEGISFRVYAWFICLFISIVYVLLYARKVKKDPTKSLVYKDREVHKKAFSNTSFNQTMTKELKIIVCLYFFAMTLIIYGIASLSWWLEEASAIFIVLAIVTAVIYKMNEQEFWDKFLDGAKNFLIAALAISFARSIVVVAQDGQIIDTILFYVANFLSGLSRVEFILVNELTQIALAFLIPSSSGHAALTIPIMAPLSDIFSIPRHAVVTSMHFASGLVNLITPTSGVLMAALSVAKIKWTTWIKFMIPLFVIQYIVTAVILYISVTI